MEQVSSWTFDVEVRGREFTTALQELRETASRHNITLNLTNRGGVVVVYLRVKAQGEVANLDRFRAEVSLCLVRKEETCEPTL